GRAFVQLNDGQVAAVGLADTCLGDADPDAGHRVNGRFGRDGQVDSHDVLTETASAGPPAVREKGEGSLCGGGEGGVGQLQGFVDDRVVVGDGDEAGFEGRGREVDAALQRRMEETVEG